MPRYDADYRWPAGYDGAFRRDLLPGYGRDYYAHEPDAGKHGWRRLASGRRRRLVPRPDWRAGGGPWQREPHAWAAPADSPEGKPHGRPWEGYPAVSRGYERRENYPRGERHSRGAPPDWRRYLSREEYGLGPGGAYDREFEGDRFRRGRLGARNALFGGEGFVRYQRDYDEQWW